MYRYFVILICLFFLGVDMEAQNFCGHQTHAISRDEMREIIRLSRLSQTRAIGCRENNVYTIPVVIHIMHTGQSVGSGINISDAQATSLIDALNRDFRATHSISQRGVYVDTRIDFCLAKQDPSGNPTTGITRHNCSSVGNYSTRGIKVFTPGTGGVTPRSIASRPGATWDVNRYLNIWVINEIDNQGQNNINTFSGGYLGFAPLSPTAGTTPITLWNTPLANPDGGTMLGVAGCFIVASACLGVQTSAQANSAGYFYWNQRLAYQGRVGTHEIGHYFGLPHTFSDFNQSVCSDGDGIGDTGNARVVGNACTGGCNNQNGENYMDYNNQNCIGEFTAGQRTVMRSRMAGGFGTMTQCTKCEPRYDLSIDNITVNENDCNLTFTGNIDVTNIGTQALNNFQIRYRVNTGGWTNYTWTGTLTSGSSTTISIPNISGVNGANNFQVEVRVNTLNTSNSDQEVSNNTGNRNFTMNQPSPVAVTASNTSICDGESTNLTATGSNSYSWNQSLGNGANKTVSPTNTQTYIVTGTTSGCSTTANIQIVVNQLPSAGSVGIINETCQNQNASFTATGSGGSSPYQYSIDNGPFSNTSSFSNLDDATYIVKVQDANGCESVGHNVTITNTGGFFSDINLDSSICMGGQASLSVTTVTSGLNYAWSNGLSNLQNHSVSPNATTTYTVDVSDQQGCSRSHSTTVNVVQYPVISTSINSVLLCRDESVSVIASGADSYEWNTNDVGSQGVVVYPTNLDSMEVVGVNQGICSTAYTMPIVQSNMSTNITQDATICSGEVIEIQANASSLQGGSVSYLWNNGLSNSNDHNVSPNSTTTYEVVITDSFGCDDTLSTTISVIQNPVLTLSTDSIALCPGDTVTISASGASEYVWGNGSITSSIELGYPANIDSINVSGVNGGICFDLRTIKIVESFMQNEITSPLTMCSGDSVVIEVETVNGVGLSYSWDNGLPNQSSHTISPSDTTAYSVTITDYIGCQDILNTSVDVLLSPSMSLSQNQITLCESDSVDIVVSGADEYSWNTGDTVNQITLVYPTGLDSLIVYGVNGGSCIRKIGIPIEQSHIDGTISDDQRVCEGNSVSIIVVSNTPNITYNWDNGLSNTNFHSVSPVQTTEYNVQLIDAIGCIDSLSTMVYVDSVPTLAVTPVDTTICEGDSVIFNASGASQYLWNTGDSLSQVIYSFQSTSTLNLTGSNGICSQQISIPVVVNPSPTINMDANTYSINTGGGVQFFSAGSVASSYLWDFGDGNTSFMGNPYHIFNFSGAYYVTLTGIEGDCEVTDSLLVYVGVVGVNENSSLKTLVYPNPVNDIVNIESNFPITEVVIYNGVGQVVYSEKTAVIKELDVSSLSAGYYYMMLNSGIDKNIHQIQIVK